MLKTCIVTLAGLVGFNSSVVKTLPENYQQWPSGKKLEYLWNTEIKGTQYSRLPSLNFPTPTQFLQSALAVANFRTTFTRDSDIMPIGRGKIIHTFGSVAPIVFEPVKNRYTGIFEFGAVGLARISLAGPPKSPAGFTPGMGVKFLVRGNPSVNLLVMNSVNGQGNNTNPFAKPFSNIVPSAEGAWLNALAIRFKMTVGIPEELSMVPMASIRPDGSRVEFVKAPKQIIFKPSSLGPRISENSKQDFRTDLAEAPPGILYEVWTKETINSDPELVGFLKTTDHFIASEFGDRNLFFKHDSETLRPLGF